MPSLTHTTSPVDYGGHGTHTLGSILGHTVGVAPDAEWYACANLQRNLANPALYLDCMQFMLAPYPQDGDPLLDIAKRLEQIALEDPYFIERKLYPNVDFYSGIILKAIGIPTSMFTVIFAVGRTVGWIAHWHEMISGSYRIGRPRQLYTGHTERDYIPVEKR